MFISNKSMKDEIKEQLKEKKEVYALTIHYENNIAGTSQWFLYETESKAKEIIETIRKYWTDMGKVISSEESALTVQDYFGRGTRMEFILERYERAA